MFQSIEFSTWQLVDIQKVTADIIIMIILENTLSSTKGPDHTP